MIWLLIIPIFEPKLFTQYSVTVGIYIFLNLLELLYFIACSLTGHKNLKYIHYPLIVWICFQMYLFLSMLVNKNWGGILQWGYLSIMVCNLILLCEYTYRNQIIDLLRTMTKYGICLLLINYLTLLVFKNGIIAPEIYYMKDNATYFLGIKTSFTTMMFPTIAAAGSLYLMEHNRKNTRLLVLAVVACILNIFAKMISTAIVGLIIISVMLITYKFTKKRLSTPILYCSALIAQIAVVFFNIQNSFSWFFKIYFHKDASLSSRTYIWEQAKKLIESNGIMHLIFGSGIAKQHTFVPYGGGHWQPHNQLLVWIYTGGLVGICIILFFFFMLTKWKTEKNAIYYFLGIISFSVLFLSVTEIYFDVAVCYVPFVLLYYIGKSYENSVFLKIHTYTELD